MIDYRGISFDPAARAGLTLVQGPYIGLGILGEVQGGLTIASLTPETRYEAVYYRPDQGIGSRFYIPNCSLRFDPSAVADAGRDPPLGSLIIAPRGVSIMVKPPRGFAFPLAILGESVANAYEGICVTSWRIESNEDVGNPEVLHSFRIDSDMK